MKHDCFCLKEEEEVYELFYNRKYEYEIKKEEEEEV